MQRLRRYLPTKWWSSFLWVVLTYLLFAAVLPNLLLLVVNCSGYLPYSDRPGPGWQAPHWPSKDELEFFLGFAVYLMRPAAFYAAAFGIIGLLFGLCSLPRWVVRLLGASLALVAAGLLMIAAGWMIAISATGIYTAGGCGLTWGLLVLPLLVVRRAAPMPMVLRVLIAAVPFVACCYFLLRPFLPNPAETEATVFVIEETPLGTPFDHLDWSGFGGMPQMKTMPTGLFAPVAISTLSMSEKRRSRVLVMLSDSESPDTVLEVPRTGDAIYSEKHKSWTTLRKPSRKASFRAKIMQSGGISADGDCCHSGTSTSWVFPPRASLPRKP